MANISTYPTSTPKAGDLVVGTQTYDINEANPVVGNPTRNFTVSSITSSQIPNYINGTVNTMPVFTAANKIGDSIITQDIGATTATVTGGLTVTNNVLIGSLGGNLTVDNESDFRGTAIFQGDLLDVSCPMKINYNILDVDNLSGTAGQVLSSTGSNVKWVDNTVTGTVTGTGTTNKLPLWTDGPNSVLSDSGFYQVPLGINTLNAIGLNTVKLDSVYGEYPDLRIASRSLNDPGVLDLFRPDGDVQAGDRVGILQYSLDDDNQYTVAQIEVKTIGQAGTGNSGGGKLCIKTSLNGLGAQPTERLCIDNTKADFLVPINVTSTLLAPDPNNPGTPTPGISGQVLSSTGTGTRWIDVASGTGTVESITALSPLTGGTITTTGNIGITQATTSTDGYLSFTDWNTFNNKSTFDGQYSSLTGAPVLAAVATSGSYNDLLNQPTIPTDNSQLANGAGYTTNLGIVQSLTTIGTSGAATLAGGVLNIPQYSAAAGGVTSLNSLTGALDIIAGTGIIVTPSGSSITIEASGGGGGATDINGLTDGATDGFSTIALSDININGFSNTVKIGYNNLMNAVSSADDVSIGYSAMSNWNGGSENVAIGSYAMEGDPSFPPTSTHSIAIGKEAMRYVSDVLGTLNDNIAIGWNSLRGSSSTLQMAGNRNIAIGSQALYEAGGALDNVAIGYNTMLGFGGQPIEASSNVAIGPNTMTQPVFASENIAIGSFAMGSFSGQDFDGVGNVAIGSNAASSIYGGAESNSTFIGYYSGNTANNGGLYNVSCLGAFSEPSTSGAQNEITLGDSSITTLRCNTQTIVGLSDARDKTDIKDLTYGLDFINLLTPREFTWNNRPEIRKVVDKETKKLIETEVRSSNVGVKDFGFIAQEVRVHDNELLNIVKDSNPDRLEMSYGKLVPILVNAIKELTARLEALEQ